MSRSKTVTRPPVRVELLNLDSPAVEMFHRSVEEFEARYAVRFGNFVERVREALRLFKRLPSNSDRVDPRWRGYLGIDQPNREVIGMCGFKGEPVDGWVEIAYGTSPDFEGRGYATEMARGLVRIATESPLVERVIAHTLREENASVRILGKLGFAFAGEVFEPEDGLVWRWVLQRSGSGGA